MKNLFQKETVNKVRSSMPFISLLLTIAVLAVTCAFVLYRYSNEKSYQRRWKDYDDCGLA